MRWGKRTAARIQVGGASDKTFELVQEVLGNMKLEYKITPDKRLIRGKTKFSLIRNKFSQKFHIVVREAQSGSVIDIYFDGVGITGPDKGSFIRPFHEKFCKLVPGGPSVDVSLVDVNDEEIEESANEMVRVDNTANRTETIADETTERRAQQRPGRHAANRTEAISYEIAKLSEMRSKGSISEEEFTRRKNDLIESCYRC